MNSRPTYKKLVSCFLLLLYFFTATPVQLWHHHVPAHGEQKAGSQTSKNLTLDEASGHSSGDCDICAHSYPAHTSDQPASPGTRVFPYELIRPGSDRPHITGSARLQSNKSPPVSNAHPLMPIA